MDLASLREAAIAATERALYDALGFVPSDESDEASRLGPADAMASSVDPALYRNRAAGRPQ